MTAFEQSFAFVVGHEGGYDTTYDDPGNWTTHIIGVGELHGTKYGISAAAYPDEDIANLSLQRAQELYRRDYWDQIAGEHLPPPLALLVFDAAVNAGVGRAARWLQAAVGAATDGRIGPRTLEAVRAMVATKGGASVCSEFLAFRMNFMACLPTWRVFGLGWARRLAALPYEAMAMADQAR